MWRKYKEKDEKWKNDRYYEIYTDKNEKLNIEDDETMKEIENNTIYHILDDERLYKLIK